MAVVSLYLSTEKCPVTPQWITHLRKKVAKEASGADLEAKFYSIQQTLIHYANLHMNQLRQGLSTNKYEFKTTLHKSSIIYRDNILQNVRSYLGEQSNEFLNDGFYETNEIDKKYFSVLRSLFNETWGIHCSDLDEDLRYTISWEVPKQTLTSGIKDPTVKHDTDVAFLEQMFTRYSSLFSQLKEWRKEGVLCDLKIIVREEGKENPKIFNAHKIVVCSSCQLINPKDSCQEIVLDLEKLEVEVTAVEQFLNLLYLSFDRNIKFDTINSWHQLLKLALHFQCEDQVKVISHELMMESKKELILLTKAKNWKGIEELLERLRIWGDAYKIDYFTQFVNWARNDISLKYLPL